MQKALFLLLALTLGTTTSLIFAAPTKPVASKASQAASKPQAAMPHSTQSMPHDMQNMPGMSH